MAEYLLFTESIAPVIYMVNAVLNKIKYYLSFIYLIKHECAKFADYHRN